jgi:hypothetical protein
MNIDTTFDELRRDPTEWGFPPRPDNRTVVQEFPASEQIKGDCPADGCEVRGTLAKYYGHNCYYECPDCGQVVMV